MDPNFAHLFVQSDLKDAEFPYVRTCTAWENSDYIGTNHQACLKSGQWHNVTSWAGRRTGPEKLDVHPEHRRSGC